MLESSPEFLARTEFAQRLALLGPGVDQRLTYAELLSRVNAQAELLSAGTKALCFLFCRNEVASLTNYLAAWQSGHAVALLNDTLDPALRHHLISEYQPSFVYAPEWCPPGAYQQLQPGLWKRQEPGPALHPNLGLMLSTSGSTGSSKFVRLTWANVLANAQSIAQALEIGPDDRAVTSLPMSYSYGLSVINTHLLRGAALVLTNESLLSGGFWDTIRTHEATALAGVPYSYQILERLRLERVNAPSLRVLTQAGGKLDNDRILRFHRLMSDRGGRFYAMYGQTEATARIAILPWNDLPEKLGSAGRAIPGGTLSVDDNGELLYQGPNVMMGYATCAADLTKGDELGGRLRTGDTATLDAGGYVYILGRAQRDVKLLGLRVNLDEVEALVKKHGPTGVVYKNDALHLFCEFGDDQQLEEIRAALADMLRIHFRAFVFHRLEQLPVKESGKIDYQRLAEIA